MQLKFLYEFKWSSFYHDATVLNSTLNFNTYQHSALWGRNASYNTDYGHHIAEYIWQHRSPFPISEF